MFYIKKITLQTGKDVVSVIDLKPGLNIIYGESNTGKSLILDCIDYMLGAEEHRFDIKLEVKRINMLLDVGGRALSLGRNIDSTEMDVSSDIDSIDSGVYTLRGKKNINSLWLTLMGIDDNVKIFQTLEGKTQKFTVRTIYHTFLLDETRIQATTSILNAGIGKNKKVGTPTLTSLLYMATGDNYFPDEIKDGAKVRKLKREAVKAFVDRSMAALENKKVNELQNMTTESPTDIQLKVDSIINEIGAAEGELDKALKKSQECADQIISIDAQITECRMLINRNTALLSQYESDIRRLTFIVEGDIHGEKLPRIEVCPFCNGQLPKEKGESCIDAAVSEVEKIEAQIKDLRSVQESISNEVKELQNKRLVVLKNRQEVESTIRGELRPKIAELRENLKKYTIALNQYKAREMIESFSDVLVKELEVTEKETAEGFTFDLRGKMREVFLEKLDTELKRLLKICNYHNFTGALFDLDDDDVVVNGHKKKSQGQGFRAFLNTIVGIAFKNVLESYDNYRFPFMVIDSPILSLKEKDDKPDGEHTSETMKSGLFKYFVQAKSSTQMIVIENVIPEIDYSGANLLEFTQDEHRGRYGLIEGYRD